jgi:hypothetical protein
VQGGWAMLGPHLHRHSDRAAAVEYLIGNTSATMRRTSALTPASQWPDVKSPPSAEVADQLAQALVAAATDPAKLSLVDPTAQPWL